MKSSISNFEQIINYNKSETIKYQTQISDLISENKVLQNTWVPKEKLSQTLNVIICLEESVEMLKEDLLSKNNIFQRKKQQYKQKIDQQKNEIERLQYMTNNYENFI